MQAKSTRTLAGEVKPTVLAPKTAYQVASFEELVTVLRSHQQPEVSLSSLDLQTVTANQRQSASTQAAAVRQEEKNAGGNIGPEEAAHPKAHNLDADGYHTQIPKKSKGAKAKARKALREGVAKSGLTSGELKSHSTQQVRTAGYNGTATAVKIMGWANNVNIKPTKRFEKFQRVEALGQYEVLASSDSEEEDIDGMDVDEEMVSAGIADPTGTEGIEDDAPYAYPEGRNQAPTESTSEQMPPSVATKDTNLEVPPIEGNDQMEVDTQDSTLENKPLAQHGAEMSLPPRRTATAMIPRKAARRLKHVAAGVGLPDGAIKGMQTSMASYMQNAAAQCTPAQPGQSQLPATLAEAKSSGDNIVRATPDSQDDVIIGETKVGTADGDADLPIQLGQWLQSFQGTEVAVAANGQCAILAILATSMNHQGREMKNSTDVVEEATELKWGRLQLCTRITTRLDGAQQGHKSRLPFGLGLMS
ncbi:hypothetical protein PF002_g26342 [Phytophthora fragariae]|uniref:Uncharacterized protein n=1 Tax=Phytophthora fragariae TaxID=53985 RepID=A0A6A3WGE4_9STRA|nr:hypothetical protein PF002_g26342 [Phytophthora fragariae]